ncbi:hypothetical protein EW146_g1479 [Bondarzewia mesenterica]|uniref:Aromatic amino acid beta-eliminating lyase/threonine aldolase domain-containing protein n=1 Tax=Bondarzewia mesenterica TaxID=1095465 RepID=A0A4S4M3L5_9AGAM|nr:hypothetical protein EW146_g1479 [Bondarzewia mesenterica]
MIPWALTRRSVRSASFPRRILSHRRTIMTANIEDARSKVADLVKFDILTPTQAEDNAKQIRDMGRCFISDTITVPSKEMYEYAVQASLGDDVYHEPSTIALEAHMAQLTGKEAALFMPSGTMSNQIALRTHLKQPPYSVVCDHRAHINKYEAGGAAFHSGAHLITAIPSNGRIHRFCRTGGIADRYIHLAGHHLTLEDVQDFVVTGTDLHFAPTEIIELENTLNGTIIPQDEVIRISDYAHSQGIKMHLDGARIWHVAAETGTPLSGLCAPFDSVSLCFSKGLGAPIGSCLVGRKEFITKARWFRKLFGGGMRQTGILAASAAYALTYNFPKLPHVHTLAQRLEQGLRDLGAEITSAAETCMVCIPLPPSLTSPLNLALLLLGCVPQVFYDPSPLGLDYAEIAERGSQLPEHLTLGGSRLVVHIQTTEQAVDDFLALIRTLAEEKRKAGFVRPESKPQTNGRPKDIYVRPQKKQTMA